ncbi:MAG TPA: ATP-dependent Clp protease proteolytic subunit [Coprothermobacter proteolyticus]|nr:ATP-dependent Clp protease proteolytic subunit [Coprothermobacter proteolyticus]
MIETLEDKIRFTRAEEVEDDDEGEVESTHPVGPNILYISGPITSETIDPAVGFVIAHNIQPEFDRIIIFINSPGGSLHHGFALSSVIKSSRVPVFTIALGECDSAGLIIAMAGDLRLIAPNCSVLSHQYSASLGMSKHIDLEAKTKDLKMTAQRVIDHYVQSTGLPEKEVKKYLVHEKDVYLSAEEAVKYNMFDDVFVSFDQLLFDFEPSEEENETKQENA